MSQTVFKKHTIETVSEEARELIEGVQEKMGFVPNLFWYLAESPPTLASYLQVSEQLEASALSPVEQNALLLAISYENRCHYCVPVHSTVLDMVGADDSLIQALRQGQDPEDEKLTALVNFARDLVQKRGQVGADAVEALEAHGYEKRHVLAVYAALSLKTISNYVNHLNQTPVDDAFSKYRWEAPSAD